MKNLKHLNPAILTRRVLLISILYLATSQTFAQRTAVWTGGTPGMESNWNVAKNWSNNRVPDEFSNVVIPDVSSTTFSNPVINEGVFELNSILVHSNAHLTLKPEAELIIYMGATGLTSENTKIEGSLLILNELDHPDVAEQNKVNTENNY